ncbi:MAG: hypothetical protein Q8P18_33320 [Pseudomonadota bacterium]|nr:hypothetical protein [Pseudomonadota bacterium]
MTTALTLLLVQGALGALDTLYYHEYRARLVGGGLHTRPELLLHAARDFLYTLLFAALPFVAFHGAFAVGLGLVLAAEIGITLADFVIEDRVRAPLGGVYAGERVMHTIMAILYGAILANLLPEMAGWFALPTALTPHAPLPPALSWLMVAMAGGVFLSGVRDLACALGVRKATFPWSAAETRWSR